LKYLRYFDNRDWDKVNEAQVRRANKAYRKQLEKLKGRLSPKAWEYFWSGFGEKSIHDAHLIALCVGDGLDRLPGQFRSNSIRIRAEFLNQNDQYRFAFEYRNIHKFTFEFDATSGQYLIDLSTKKYIFDPKAYIRRNRIDDAIGDELTAFNNKYLRHEVVFQSGARFIVLAETISFHRKRVKELNR
jgi:hypothetical protein